METIRRLIAKLDVDIYGGQRVFIYFAENTKAQGPGRHARRHLRPRRPGPAITGTQQTRGRPAALEPVQPASAPLPPPPSTRSVRRPSRPAGARPAGRLPGRLGRGRPPPADIRFVADEVTNAIIVTTYPRLWKEIEETIKKLDRCRARC